MHGSTSHIRQQLQLKPSGMLLLTGSSCSCTSKTCGIGLWFPSLVADAATPWQRTACFKAFGV
jgi:hypothetical protein